MTPHNLYFVLSGKVTNGGVSMWCELAQVGFLLPEGVSGDSSHEEPWTCLSSQDMMVSTQLLLLPPQVNFFDEYQMEGVSSEDNEICLEVAPDNLSRALKTIQNAKSMKVKLTKKHCPCLTIAAELVSGDGGTEA